MKIILVLLIATAALAAAPPKEADEMFVEFLANASAPVRATNSISGGELKLFVFTNKPPRDAGLSVIGTYERGTNRFYRSTQVKAGAVDRGWIEVKPPAPRAELTPDQILEQTAVRHFRALNAEQKVVAVAIISGRKLTAEEKVLVKSIADKVLAE